MRIPTIVAAAAFAALPLAATAQIQTLPSESRSEGQLNQMNSSMQQQQQIRGIQQQGTIDNNRTQMQIQTAPRANPVPAPSVVPIR